MSFAVVHTRAELGIEAPEVTVEVHIGGGLPRFNIVGLPETAVRESRDRVRGAIIQSRFRFPDGRITANLAPADLPKEGSRFDLAIALAILAASGQLPAERLKGGEYLGELALSGSLRGVRGALTAALAARGAARFLLTASAVAPVAARASGLEVYGAEHLLDVTAHLSGEQPLPVVSGCITGVDRGPVAADLAEVRGQPHARRALEIAAAGRHSLLLVGPPGTGKTMLATRLAGLLPSMSEDEALETAAVHSLAGVGDPLAGWGQRPFRAPHHSASAPALVGGGGHPRPGEISLAHNGVLFLDELPEFDRRVLETLREPLESGTIHIARAARSARFPARFQLVAAMNPCPCGYLGDPAGRCRCSSEQIRRYRGRLSGPLLDRIDMHVEVPPLPRKLMTAPEQLGEDSATVRRRVEAASECQQRRQGHANSALTGRELESVCGLDDGARLLIERAVDRLHLSARGLHRVLRVARTVADLNGSDTVSADHLAESVQYRVLDRGM